ncbi:type II toxin-antitoxin system RelE/ParE family toxin [Schlesneria sp.]|uniref:type II toxin-antitoxin system RelE/ParE family toxin n=1 Tax=Schlesneria sp. TaxID=2762018 RepID=UPI002F04B088
MSFHVVVSRRAKADIREIVTWIRERSAKGAVSWVDALEKSLKQLERTPGSRARAVEADEFKIDLRQQHFKTRRGNTYRIIFVVRETTVHVLTVRGAGQDFLQPDEIDLTEES